MTENEARTKWCPMVRIEEETGSFNRLWNSLKRWFPSKDGGVDTDKISNCIASDCMMWRLEYALCRNGKPLEPEESYSAGDPTVIEMATGGYCGLAGKP